MDYIFQLISSLGMGVKYTAGLFIITLLLSFPLGFGLVFIRRCRFAPLRGIAAGYVWLMRGTPLLLQLYFIYYGLPAIPYIGEMLTFDRFTAACIAFVLNYTAYFCEIFRGGIKAIPRGQYDAAHVLGMSPLQTQTRIVIPQMLRVVLPALGNESMTLVKDTAMVTAIGVTEILYFAKAAVNRDVDATAYIVAAAFYLMMNTLLSRLFKRLEARCSF